MSSLRRLGGRIRRSMADRWRSSNARLRNRFTHAPVVAAGGPAVSLTTYGKRLGTVFLTLEAIGRGTLLPSRLILWLDDAAAFEQPPVELRRLVRRGLEIKLADRDYGPHKKYYPYVATSDDLSIPLVTADDDVLYPPFWLAGLERAYREHPDCVSCFRARAIQLDADGNLRSYVHWNYCTTSAPRFSHLLTGGEGVIYPPAVLRALRAAGDGFLHTCPRADDLWLHVHAIRAGYRIKQIGDRATQFPDIPGSQAAALYLDNMHGGGNDLQAAATYTEQDLAILRQEAKELDQ